MRDRTAEAFARLLIHEHDGIQTFLFDCQRCEDVNVLAHEIAGLRQDLQHQCEANARLAATRTRPWWRRWR